MPRYPIAGVSKLIRCKLGKLGLGTLGRYVNLVRTYCAGVENLVELTMYVPAERRGKLGRHLNDLFTTVVMLLIQLQ